MSVLYYGLILFLLAFLIHLLVWRISLPRNHTHFLLILFFLIMAAGMALFNFFPAYGGILGVPFPQTICGQLRFALFFISLTLAYLVTYSCIEVESPSLMIALKIASGSRRGVAKEILHTLAKDDDLLVKPRIEDLLRDKMICLQGDKFKLSRKGLFLTRIFILYRKVLGAGKGG